MKFEDYLRTKHAEGNIYVLDDYMPDDFERWLADLEVDEVIDYAEEALKESKQIDSEGHYQECDDNDAQSDDNDLCICTQLKQDRQDEEDNNAVDERMGN